MIYSKAILQRHISKCPYPEGKKDSVEEYARLEEERVKRAKKPYSLTYYKYLAAHDHKPYPRGGGCLI
jgi:hypothetical protein